eukprot:g13639.t1
MVRVEEEESTGSSSHDDSVPGGRGGGGGGGEASQPPSPPPAAPAAILAQCLKLLRGQSDEHKFAGLVMVTKHVPALTSTQNGSSNTGSSSDSPSGGGGGQLRQICSAVGPAFVHRLLRTPGDESGGGGGGGEGSSGGLSVYQQIALGVLAAFFRDESLVKKFVPVAPALVRALRAADARTQTQGLCDALYCAQALAGVPGGMERLQRAGAAPAVVSRLSAESGDRTAAAAAAAAAAAKTAEAKEKAKADQGASSGGVSSTEPGKDGGGDGGGDGPAERAESLAFAFVGRALEASGGNCLGLRELTVVAEAFRDDPTPAKFRFMDLLLRWASLQEEQPAASANRGGGGVAVWTKTGPFPAALREGLLQALHGAAADERRDSALALLASLLRAVGQEWAVEAGEEEAGARGVANGSANGAQKKEGGGAARAATARRKRGTFVAFAVRCAAGEVRILLDEALSLFVPAAARGGGAAGASCGDGDDEAGPGTGQRARGAMGPAGADPSIGIAAEIAGANAADAAATAGDNGEANGEGGEKGTLPNPPRAPLSAAELKAIKEQRSARLLRMVPVALGVAESTIAFLCGGEGAGEDGDGGEGDREGGERSGRWDELPIDTLQDLQKTLVGLFGCVLDFFSEIRRWIVVTPPGGSSRGANARANQKRGTESSSSAPSIVDLWAIQRLGLECSRVLGVWVAEDPESLPQRFLEVLPVLLALNAGEEAPDSDDEESDQDSDDEDDDDDDDDNDPTAITTPTLAAFPGAARYMPTSSRDIPSAWPASSAAASRADAALHNVLRAMLALSYEAAPLAAMVEEGVTARLARLAAAGPPAIASLLLLLGGRGEDNAAAAAASSSPLLAPPEQVAEAVRSPLITACGLLTNILTSAGHLAWPEKAGHGGGGGGAGQPARPPSHPVLGHPGMGECLASLAEVAGAAGAARRAGGGTRWRLVAAHATLVVMTVARAATPGNGLAPARGLADRKVRWLGEDGGDVVAGKGARRPSAPAAARTVWEGMARAVDEALGSLSAVPGRRLIGSGGGEDEEASYEEGAIWQWCLECAREMEAASGGASGNPYVSSGVVPRRMLKSLIEASSAGRI